MVGLFKALLSPLLLATFAASQNVFDIFTPSSTIWWVAKSENQMSWDCKNPQAVAIGTFTVLVNSPNFVAPLAIIAEQANADCIKSITQDQANQPAGTGYTVLLANPLNNTQVYATSQPFEIRPLGSQYPSQVSSSASGASGTATGTSTASASPSKAAALGLHSPSFLGLTGIMGLLTFGLLGA